MNEVLFFLLTIYDFMVAGGAMVGAFTMLVAFSIVLIRIFSPNYQEEE